MPKEDDIYQLGKAVSSIETAVSGIAKSIEDKSGRDEKYFEALFKNQKDTNEAITKILIRQEGMDERASAHYKSDDAKFGELEEVANDVEDLKKDKWKVQGVASFIAVVTGALSALGITLSLKHGP